MNYYQQVKEFHKAFGLKIAETPDKTIFDTHPDVVKLRYSLISEEYHELNDAIGDLKETVDALMDMLYVIYGSMISFGSEVGQVSISECIKNSEITEKSEERFGETKEHFGELLKQLENSFADKAFYKSEDILQHMIDCTLDMCLYLGIITDEPFNIVHSSNMSKLCDTEDLAKETVQWYRENSQVYDSPNYRFNDELKLWVIYNESTGKILKSIKYTEVDFTDYITKLL